MRELKYKSHMKYKSHLSKCEAYIMLYIIIISLFPYVYICIYQFRNDYVSQHESNPNNFTFTSRKHKFYNWTKSANYSDIICRRISNSFLSRWAGFQMGKILHRCCFRHMAKQITEKSIEYNKPAYTKHSVAYSWRIRYVHLYNRRVLHDLIQVIENISGQIKYKLELIESLLNQF